MLRKINIFLSLVVILFFSGSCVKNSDEPVFDIQPVIEIGTVSQDTIVQFQDQLSIQIYYEDGDGDLGHPDSEVNSLFVKDARLENEDAYYLAPVAPVGANVSITGSLNIILDQTFLLGNADQEQTTFSIYLIDQAGHQSNTIQTSPITIIRE